MPEITAEGSYNVTIKQATFSDRSKQDNPGAYAINILGETPDGCQMWGTINFSHTIISGGQNAGKTVAEASRELLLDLGVKDGYEGNVQSAIDQGLDANFTVKWDNYDPDHPKLKVAFVNPPRDIKPISEVNWDEVMAKFNGTTPPQHEATVPPPQTNANGTIAEQPKQTDEPADPNAPRPF